MAFFKCKMCGGTLETEEGTTVGICEYCGTKQTLPNTNDDIIANRYNRANNLRLKGEFDRATTIYDDIVKNDDSQAEAHWGIVLCKYGIEYVEDPKTHKRIPTCHRASYDAIRTDADYQAAIDYSDFEQQAIYESEAREIDKIQKSILEIAENEKPFDVFICYKETDENGKKTIDSTIANDIYYQLSQEGFKVFFAAITLEEKLGQEYEPYIFAALNTAKVMLVLGTKPEYFSSVWVKNEWSRFLRLIKNNRNKLLIPCYRNMDAYDLPEEFSHLQAQDMSKIGFINDITRGIRKLLTKEEKSASTTIESLSNGNGSIVAFLERGYMALEDQEWQKADDFFEKALNFDAKNYRAYFGKLLSNIQISREEDIKNCFVSIDENNNYKKALKFADSSFKSKLIEYASIINSNVKKREIEVTESLKKKKEEFDKKVEAVAESISYRIISRSNNNLQEQHNSVAIKLSKLKKILESYDSNADKIKVAEKNVKETEDEMIQLTKKLEKLGLFARKEKEAIKENISELALQRDENNRKIEYFKKSMSNYFGRKEVLQKDILGLETSIANINTQIETINSRQPSLPFEEAISILDANKESIIVNDKLLFIRDAVLSNYPEVNEYYQIKSKVESITNFETVNYVTFGNYYKSNKSEKEPITWRVLDRKDNKVLLLSQNSLDAIDIDLSATWSNNRARVWLNNNFFNAAFSIFEQSMIAESYVKSDDNPRYSTVFQGPDTKDRLFLLSIKEAEKYSLTGGYATEYAKNKKACAGGKEVYPGAGYETIWWFRTRGKEKNWLCCYNNGICYDGIAGTYALISSDMSRTKLYGGICPAVWIEL